MRIRDALGFILFGWPARRRPRGTPALLRDLAAVERMTGRERGGRHRATERLVDDVGTALLRELERNLGLDGQLVAGTSRRSRVRRAA